MMAYLRPFEKENVTMALYLCDFLPRGSFPTINLNPKFQQAFYPQNFSGQWESFSPFFRVPNPLTDQLLIEIPSAKIDNIIASMSSCPPYGLHNPLYQKERYVSYGQICARAADTLAQAEIAAYFAHLINTFIPKGYDESMGEVTVVRDFLYNLAGDGCRYLAESFSRPGNRTGQEASGYRWPYGPVAIITPFNFPLEIPALQLVSALAMGNKVLLKPDMRVAPVAEAFVRLLLACGMPQNDMCLLHADGPTTEHLMRVKRNHRQPLIRLIQFTGSTRVAKRLMRLTDGRVKVEDSGFDWKILGPNFIPEDFEPVTKQCDKDAYNISGQKCSAQSFLIAHKRWVDAGLWEKLAELANSRSLSDLSIGPVLTWSNSAIEKHLKRLLKIKGARILFGGSSVDQTLYAIPSQYGCFQPTAIFVPLAEILPNLDLVAKEVFGPVQVVTQWDTQEDLDLIITLLNELEQHLTAGVVDRDVTFVEYILGRTINGTTYAGILGRTTGAPQWHYFGPAGHPASAGIGTPEAIRSVWTCHREIIRDWGNTVLIYQ